MKEQADAKFGGANLFHEIKPEPASENANLIEPKTLYSCTTCLSCVETCPVGVEHVPLIVKMRRALVEEGTMETNLQKVLERIAMTGNSFGQPEDERGSWTSSLPFKVKDATQEPVDVLWFVGDYASFDAGLQEITRKVATILHRAEVNFGILYAAERNSGNDVRRVGEEGLYQMLAEMNIAAIAQAQFKEIITTDPHSYNTLVNEYPEFGGTYKVRHHTELIWELIESGALPVANRLSGAATYHDPCHLARYVGVTDAPRAILGAVGVELREMPRNRENTFCCGAGGGRIWMTDTGDKDRPSVQRIHEALEIPGLEYFVVTCPKDLAMYRDAAKTVGNERLKVTDLVELVEAATAS
ncbi:(Fe-S)-binding protein [Paraburkholderia dipogonis]|uniref:(Fe-S)-binding protein n=1 Tax=Paraburkholderia dipogonis TaxID=1211383 RepID=UPI003608647E